MIKNIKEKMISTASSASGATSILGSWQICHNLCLGMIAFLAILGITVIGMPLMFLTRIAVPFWIAALVLLFISFVFYFRKKCISNQMILINSGLIMVGIPFQPLQKFRIFFWLIGGTLVIIGVFMAVKNKIEKRRMKNEKKI